MSIVQSSNRPRIVRVSSPQVDASGLVRLRLGDPLAVTVELAGDTHERHHDDVVELWTNVDRPDAPSEYRALAMPRVGPQRFALALPVRRVGNYRATARVRRADDLVWASESGIADLRFRPRDPAYDALCIEEVSVAHVNWDPFAKRPGTFSDLLDDTSAYHLHQLRDRGVNAIWLMPPFPVALWPGRHALDEAGSPYAVADYFSIRRELLREPHALDGGIGEVRRFLDAAHGCGVRVVLDVALNHLGHEHLLRDVSLHDLDARTGLPRVTTRGVLEDVAPWMLADRHGDARGCRQRDDKLAGGTFEWHDTAKLNHGRARAWRYAFHDVEPPRTEHLAVRAWLEQVLSFWVHVGVDGFRLDHLCGLPPSMLEHELNRVQARAEQRHGRRLLLIGEDFHTHAATLPFLDAGQSGWFRELLAARSASALRGIVDDPWFRDVLCVSTHDEERPVVALGDDLRAWQRLASLLLLVGGPVAFVAGDHVGERVPLPFKRWRGVPALRNPSASQRSLGDALARLGRARHDVRALRAGQRQWLATGTDDVLAFARRVPGDPEVAVVVANWSNHDARDVTLDVDGHAVSLRVEPYEVLLTVRTLPSTGR